MNISEEKRTQICAALAKAQQDIKRIQAAGELIQTYHKFGETENESLFFFSPLFPRKGIFIPSILSVHKPVVPNVSQ